MSKHETKELWIKSFRKFETDDWDLGKYYFLVTPQKEPFKIIESSIVFKKRN